MGCANLQQMLLRHFKSCICDEDSNTTPRSPQLLGIVGPSSSSCSIQVQNILKLFRIPQISYSATAVSLRDVKKYPYFSSVVPSDMFQALLLLKILRHYNWTLVSIIYSDNEYGQSGFEQFQKWADYFEICIKVSVPIKTLIDDVTYAAILQQLSSEERVKVVVSFCDQLAIQGFLHAMEVLGYEGKFLILGSDGWTPKRILVRNHEKQVLGSIVISIHMDVIPEFEKYFLSRNVTNNRRNPWFEKFWEIKFKCKFGTTNNSSVNKCTGNEKLVKENEDDFRISNVIESIFAFAYKLHELHEDVCAGKPGPCDDLYPFRANKLMKYDEILSLFDENPETFGHLEIFKTIKYDIYNYQKFKNGTYDFVHIGEFDFKEDYIANRSISDSFGHLRFTENIKVQFLNGLTTVPVSSCTNSCPLGMKTCTFCAPDEILSKEGMCIPCGIWFRPNANKSGKVLWTGYSNVVQSNGCDPVPEAYIQWTDPQSLISLTFSSIGIVLTLITTVIFVKHRETPVVKSSTRELCYFMLFGMMTAHSIPLVVMSKPTLLICCIVKIVPIISFTIIYSALLVKTNRIARILAIKKTKFPNMHPRFMSLKAQVIITGILIIIGIILCCMTIYLEPPKPEALLLANKKYVFCPSCKFSAIIHFSYIGSLIFVCAVYAVKTRNLPDNFNEAKFIGFAVYVTCITWMAFIIIYFDTIFNHLVTTCVCSSISAMVILSFLFFPKLYIIIWHPERNNRANFVTCKGIRCIIGSCEKSTSVS